MGIIGFWNKSLMFRLVYGFLLLSLIVVSLVGYTAYVRATGTLTQSVYDRLDAVSTLKEQTLNNWVDDQIQDTLMIAGQPYVRNQAGILLSANSSDPAYRLAYHNLSEYLNLEVMQPSYSEELFILDTGGRIVLSTDRENEGLSQQNVSYFRSGLSGTFVQNVYRSYPSGRPLITIVTPIFNTDGRRIGVLASHLSIERIDRIILEDTGLGSSGDTYLVDRSYSLISRAPVRDSGDAGESVYSSGIDTGLRGKDGYGLYRNYEGIPVIGVYNWIDERDMVLMAEMSQEEAFAPARELAWSIFLTGLLLSAMLALGILWLAHRTIRPILAIAETAARISDGDLNETVPVMTDDEIGTLAQAFNRMTQTLRQTLEGLELQVQERTSELNAANKVLQHEIAERTQLMEELKISEEKYRTLFESSIDGIVRMDIDRHILDANPAYCAMVGYSLDELREKTSFDITPVKWHGTDRDILASQVRKVGFSEEYEKEYVRKDGTVFPISVRFWFEPGISGGTPGIWGFVRDITERKNLYGKLEASLREKELLLKEIHHRVKNNLQIVISLLNLQLRYIDDRQIVDALKESQNRIRAMSLVHEKLYRSEDISKIGLAEYISFLAGNLFRFYGVKPGTISLDIDAGDIAVDINTAVPLGLIINELVSNSLKYAFPEGKEGKISIIIKKENGGMRLVIRDNGVGIPEGLDWKNPPSLGLRLVTSLTEQLNGTIDLDRGGGTIFTIVLSPKIQPAE